MAWSKSCAAWPTASSPPAEPREGRRWHEKLVGSADWTEAKFSGASRKGGGRQQALGCLRGGVLQWLRDPASRWAPRGRRAAARAPGSRRLAPTRCCGSSISARPRSARDWERDYEHAPVSSMTGRCSSSGSASSRSCCATTRGRDGPDGLLHARPLPPLDRAARQAARGGRESDVATGRSTWRGSRLRDEPATTPASRRLLPHLPRPVRLERDVGYKPTAARAVRALRVFATRP